jgi:hypothetical protein
MPDRLLPGKGNADPASGQIRNSWFLESAVSGKSLRVREPELGFCSTGCRVKLPAPATRLGTGVGLKVDAFGSKKWDRVD